MEIEEIAHRIHVTIRRKGEPIFISSEYKTEKFNDLDELLDNLDHFIEQEISMDMEEGSND